MAGRIRRMGRRAFGESLRKEVVPISVEAALHRLGVEHVVVHVALERVAMASQNLAHNRAARLGTVPEVNRPFLIPHAVQRKASDCRERGRDIGTTEGAEAVLLGGTDVGITRVRGAPIVLSTRKATKYAWKSTSKWVYAPRSRPLWR